MSKVTQDALLRASDPVAVKVHNPMGKSRIVLTCDHAGRAVPAKLDNLGLGEHDLSRHIAWDIGAAAMAHHIADLLDAPLVMQTYSRLVIDCNRPLSSTASIPIRSDGSEIPGNSRLSSKERLARQREIHRTYHEKVGSVLSKAEERGFEPILIAIHTFTSALEVDAMPRPWDISLLYNRDQRVAVKVHHALRTLDLDQTLNIGHNEPYAVCDETDYTIPVHGESRGIPSVLVEVRNDHVDAAVGIERMGALLANAIRCVESPP